MLARIVALWESDSFLVGAEIRARTPRVHAFAVANWRGFRKIAATTTNESPLNARGATLAAHVLMNDKLMREPDRRGFQLPAAVGVPVRAPGFSAGTGVFELDADGFFHISTP